MVTPQEVALSETPAVAGRGRLPGRADGGAGGGATRGACGRPWACTGTSSWRGCCCATRRSSRPGCWGSGRSCSSSWCGGCRRWSTTTSAAGREDEGIGAARRLLALEPWREEVHRQLMVLLARGGQRSAALKQFEVCRRVLAEELQTEPDVATVALAARLRAGPRPVAHNLPPEAVPLRGSGGGAGPPGGAPGRPGLPRAQPGGPGGQRQDRAGAAGRAPLRRPGQRGRPAPLPGRGLPGAAGRRGRR